MNEEYERMYKAFTFLHRIHAQDMSPKKVVLITGTSAGIGKALEESLSNIPEKYVVVGCARRFRTEKIGASLFHYKCDLEKSDEIEGMFAWILNHEELGRIDVAVLNAGRTAHKGLLDLAPEVSKKCSSNMFPNMPCFRIRK